MNKKPVKHLYVKRIITYWAAFCIGYVFPFVYFFVTAGVKKQSSRWVLPTLIAGIFMVIKLATDIPKWTETWRPSFWKGMLQATPKLLLFMILMTVGILLEWALTTQIKVAFYMYFETVIVLFGGQALGAIVAAFHLKYRQLDMINKGYVLGVVNK